jgi:hypothetical protein
MTHVTVTITNSKVYNVIITDFNVMHVTVTDFEICHVTRLHTSLKLDVYHTYKLLIRNYLKIFYQRKIAEIN